MVRDLIDIASDRLGSKRQLGIALGFPEKYAGQRVQKLIDNPNITLDIFKKLLEEAQLLEMLEVAIAERCKNINL